MADISGAGGSTHGNEQAATQYLQGQGVANPSSGLIGYVANGSSNYGPDEAQQYGLPLTSGMINQQRQSAIAPAVSSYQSSIPEIQNVYNTKNSQLEAQKQPLMDRYQTLLSSMTGRVQTQNAQEYGKRGIDPASGVVQQANTNQILPYQQTIGLAREADMRDLADQQANLGNAESTDLRSVYNSIANLQAGAGNSAVTDALGIYNTNAANKFSSRFDATDQAIKNAQLANETNSNAGDQLKIVGGNLYLVNSKTGASQLVQSKVGNSANSNNNNSAGL